jgi:hypothetical protein
MPFTSARARTFTGGGGFSNGRSVTSIGIEGIDAALAPFAFAAVTVKL